MVEEQVSPEIHAAYARYVESGKYPYLQAVTDSVANELGIEDKEKLRSQLYEASRMYRLEKMVAEEYMLREQGYEPITGFSFRAGQRVRLYGVDTPLRITKNRDGRWFGLPPRNSRRGYDLSSKASGHVAYEKAKATGKLGMSGEQVVMIKEVI